MTYDATIPYTGTGDPYAKPVPSGQTPSDSPWSADVVTKDAASTAGFAIFKALPTGVPHWIYIAPSGSPAANDDTLFAIVDDSVADGGSIQIITGRSQTIHLEIDQAGNVQIPAYRADGSPVDWSGKTLRFTAADNRNAILLDLADGAITRTAGSFTITIGGTLTAKRRTLRWRLLEVTGGNEIEILQGLFPVY